MDEPGASLPPPPSRIGPAILRILIIFAPIVLLLGVMSIALASYGAFINGSIILPKFTLDAALLEGHRPPNSFVEGKHRLLFHSAAFVQLLTVIGSAGFAFVISAYQLRWKGPGFQVRLRIAAGAVLAAMLVAFLGNLDAHSRLNLQLFEKTMISDPAVSAGNLALPVTKVVLSTLSFWAAFLLAGAAAAVSSRILRIRRPSPIRLKRTGRTLTVILVCAAGLLVAQVLTARAWEVWIAEYVPASVAPDAAALGEAVVVGIGIFSSAGLAAIYLPAQAIVHSRVRITAYLAVGKPDPEAAEKWIKEQGLQAGVAANIGKIAVVLGPALTGGFFEALAKI